MQHSGAALLAAAITALSGPAVAESVVDQANPLSNLDGGLEIHDANASQGAARHFVAQTFTVGKTGWLTRVDVAVAHHRCTPVGNLYVDVVRTEAGVPGDLVMTGAALTPEQVPASGIELVPVDFGADAEPVVVGDVLGIVVSTDAAYPCNYAWQGEFPGDYAAGATWCHHGTVNASDQCLRDMAFQTWVADTRPVSGPPIAPPEQPDQTDPPKRARSGDIGSTTLGGAMGWSWLLCAMAGVGLRARRRRGAATG